MAEIRQVTTGKRVETHVYGRVFRSQPQFSKSAHHPKSPERRRVCVLSNNAGQMLAQFGQSHPCFGAGCHDHQTREAVDALVREGVLRWVGRQRNVAAYSFGRTWRGVPSGGPKGPKVMQLVCG